MNSIIFTDEQNYNVMKLQKLKCNPKYKMDSWTETVFHTVFLKQIHRLSKDVEVTQHLSPRIDPALTTNVDTLPMNVFVN